MSKELITVIVAAHGGIIAAQHDTLGLYELLDILKKDDPVWACSHVSTILMPKFVDNFTLHGDGVAFKFFS